MHPEHTGKVRMILKDPVQHLVRHCADRAGCEHRNRMIHLFDQEAVQADEVAQHVKGCDLAPSTPEKAVAGSKARDEDRTLGGAVALPHDILSLCHHPLPDDGFLQKLLFRAREAVILLKLTQKVRTQYTVPSGE
jgi:hypothetical protein